MARKDISIDFGDDPEEVQVTRTRALNLVHVSRITGDTSPPGTPNPVPFMIRGAADLARKTRPSISTELRDEYGGDSEQKFNYSEGVKTANELRNNLHPDNVVLLGRSPGAKVTEHGVLMRLRTKQAAVDDMLAQLEEWEHPKHAKTFNQLKDNVANLTAGLRSEIQRLSDELNALSSEKYFDEAYEKES